MQVGGAMRLVALMLVAVVLAGCAAESDEEMPNEPQNGAIDPIRDPTSPAFKPHVVVAVIDTGNNPYHEQYREQYDDAHPSAYIPDYPEVVDLELTLNVTDLPGDNRPMVDQAIWDSTAPGVLYRIPGTKIIGHYSVGADLPGSGHGTMTASRATANDISVAGNATRLVVVQGFTIDAVRWAADQPWIDIISISSGISLGGLAPAAANVENQAGIDAFQYAAHKKPFFASSGNGVGNAGVLGFPAWTRGPSGAPDVISVGANENGDMAVWHNFHPYIVGDGCDNPSAQDGSVTAVADTGGGTSSATPFSAGAGASLLLEARRLLGDAHVGIRYAEGPIASWNTWDSLSPSDATIILAAGDPQLHNITSGPLADGIFTQQEFKDVLYHTAIPAGTDDPSDGAAPCVGIAQGVADGDMVPTPVLIQYNGYGEVNHLSIETAHAVLAGETALPTYADMDEWYPRYHTARMTTCVDC